MAPADKAITTIDHTAVNAFDAVLFALIIALGTGLHSGMSAHLISILSELGFGAGAAIAVASLRGIGQSAARLIELKIGSRLHPIDLNTIASLLIPFSFTLGLFSGGWIAAAATFALIYGAATGLLTITRGTLPLVLFDHKRYGSIVGKLLIPSFVTSAVAPIAYASMLDHYGAGSAFILSIFIGIIMVAVSILLKARQKG